MVKVNINGTVGTFETRAEASRYVRECIKLGIKAQIITDEVIPTGRLGGYGMTASLKPVHAL